MLLRPGYDLAPIRRGLLEAVGFTALLLVVGPVIADGDEAAAVVIFGWPLILFYWLARWSGKAAVAVGMLAVPLLFAFVLVGGLIGGVPVYNFAVPFLPLAAVAATLFAESRSAQ